MQVRPSPNCNSRPQGAPIDMLVLHYTGMPEAADALDRLCDPATKVSSHYLIDENGAVHALVPEDRRAWHAGVSFWRGETDVNGRSIGIELSNPGHDFGYRPFPETQMAALIELAGDIIARHPIPARNVVGHSDIAPRRKIDPGELFDWPRLAAAGIGLWPDGAAGQGAEENPEDDPAALLAAIGYGTEELQATLSAFQRRYRPARFDGIADAETLGLLRAVCDLAEIGR